MHAPIPLLIAGVTATTGIGIGSIAINTGALDDFGTMIQGTVASVGTAFANGIELAGPTKTKQFSEEETSDQVLFDGIEVEDQTVEHRGDDSAEPQDETTPSVDPSPSPDPKNHGTSGGSASGDDENEEDDDDHDDDDDDHDDDDDDHDDEDD